MTVSSFHVAVLISPWVEASLKNNNNKITAITPHQKNVARIYLIAEVKPLHATRECSSFEKQFEAHSKIISQI